MNTEIHNLTKRVRELETEAKEVNTLKQQIFELDAQLAAKCNAQEVADVACNLRWHQSTMFLTTSDPSSAS